VSDAEISGYLLIAAGFVWLLVGIMLKAKGK
jgi:hypothetical protein